jgi:membrane protease subunit (stomatin/prohibitin family)
MRWQAFHAGANMVTHCRHALATALHKVSQQQQLQQQQQQIDQHAAAVAGHSCTCDWCGLPELSAAEYWMHQQLYHINHDNKPGTCQVCGK